MTHPNAKKLVTIDEALATLKKAKAALGGDACLILSLTGSGIDDANVNDLVIVKEGKSRYVEVRCLHPSIAEGQ